MAFGFLKKIGKAALPFAGLAAAPFTGGLSLPLAMGVGGGLGAAGGAVTGGRRGALLGGLAGGAGAGALGALGGGAGGVLPSTPLGTLAQAGANPGGAGSVFSRLMSPEVLSAAGRGLGAVSQTQASNRGSELEAELALRDQEQQASMLGLRRADDTLSRQGFTPSTMSIRGRSIESPDFGLAGPAASEDERAAAEAERERLLALLDPGRTDELRGLTKPGRGERFLNILGPALTIGGAFRGRS